MWLRPVPWQAPTNDQGLSWQNHIKRMCKGKKMRGMLWNLVDVNSGVLDRDYFAVAMHLTMRTKRGQPLPTTLPPELVPPAHR